jgi:alcohol dehydrogenase (cytochrome c)/quinohemoprotein ethanol dehydrogenase
MSYSPKTGLVYIPTQEDSFPYSIDPSFKPAPKGVALGINLSVATMPVDPKKLAAIHNSVKGYITAWDPVAGRAVWRVPQPTHANGGMLSTAGNVLFEGGAAGFFKAYDAATGRTLWTYDVQSGMLAPPVTWSRNGRQYVTVLTGWGTSEGLGNGVANMTAKGLPRNVSRVLTFALDGRATLAKTPAPAARKLDPPAQFADAATIEQGCILYHRTCYACHGASAVSGGVVPDLRFSPTIANPDAWKAVLIDGILSDAGMVSFKDTYTPQQIEAIRAYVIGQAQASAKAGVK